MRSTKNKKAMVLHKSKVLSTIKIKFVVIRIGLLYIKMLIVILRATTNKMSQRNDKRIKMLYGKTPLYDMKEGRNRETKKT